MCTILNCFLSNCARLIAGKSIPQQTPRRVLGDLKNSAAQRQSLSTRKGSLLQTPRVNIDQKGTFQKLKKASEKKQFKKEKTVLPAKSSGTLPSDADSEIEYMAPPEVDKKEPFVTPSFIKSFVNFKPLLLPRKRLSHKQNDQEEINFEEILSASQPEHLISKSISTSN